jgi:hypothetical protein
MEIEIDRRLREALNYFRTLQLRYSSSKAMILCIPCLVHSDCCGRQRSNATALRAAQQQHKSITTIDARSRAVGIDKQQNGLVNLGNNPFFPLWF